MAVISSNFNFPTSRQVPDQAIMDLNGKQSYLGNVYSLLNGTAGNALTQNVEKPIILIKNAATTAKSIFISDRMIAANDAVIARYYINPTIATFQTQTVALVADSSGSLNSTYFLLSDSSGNNFYVWFNINSAGVDPAIAGRTGIAVAGATNASAATLGAAMATAIAAAHGAASFSTSGTATVTITQLVAGYATPATDGAAPTGFTFALTHGFGTAATPNNLRPANGNTSISSSYVNPVPTSNGTLVGLQATVASVESYARVLLILDPGQTLLITAKTAATGVTCYQETVWYEL